MPNPPRFDPLIVQWLAKHGLTPPAAEHPDWGFKLSLSTVPVWDWTVQRSRIKAHELWFAIVLSRITGWKALLHPRDESFRITWGSGQAMDVTAQSLIHRHRTAWPALAELDALPSFIGTIESLLGQRFQRTAEFSAPSLKSSDFAVLAALLRPLCGELILRLGTLHGLAPDNVEIEDNRAENAGLRVRLPCR